MKTRLNEWVEALPLVCFFVLNFIVIVVKFYVIYLFFFVWNTNAEHPNDMRINGFLMNCQMCCCLFSKLGCIFFIFVAFQLKSIGKFYWTSLARIDLHTKTPSILTNLIGIFRFFPFYRNLNSVFIPMKTHFAIKYIRCWWLVALTLARNI